MNRKVFLLGYINNFKLKHILGQWLVNVPIKWDSIWNRFNYGLLGKVFDRIYLKYNFKSTTNTIFFFKGYKLMARSKILAIDRLTPNYCSKK